MTGRKRKGFFDFKIPPEFFSLRMTWRGDNILRKIEGLHVVRVVTFGDTFLTESEILRLASLAQYDSAGVLHS